MQTASTKFLKDIVILQSTLPDALLTNQKAHERRPSQFKLLHSNRPSLQSDQVKSSHRIRTNHQSLTSLYSQPSVETHKTLNYQEPLGLLQRPSSQIMKFSTTSKQLHRQQQRVLSQGELQKQQSKPSKPQQMQLKNYMRSNIDAGLSDKFNYKSAILPVSEIEKIEYEKTVIDRINADSNRESSFAELKTELLTEIQQSKYFNEILQRRIQRLKELLNVFEMRIEFEDQICLKEGDVSELKKLINSLAQTVVNTSQTELNLRLKEREELALKSEYNNLKHKFEIVHKEKQHVENNEKHIKESFKKSEEKLMQLKKDIHLEKRKNEFLSRRLLEMEKSLNAMTEDMAPQNAHTGFNKGSINEGQLSVPQQQMVTLSKIDQLKKSDNDRMRQVMQALNKQNQSLKKELDLYKKQFNEKVEDIETLNTQMKRLQDKVNFGIKNMFQSKLKKLQTLGGTTPSSPNIHSNTSFDEDNLPDRDSGFLQVKKMESTRRSKKKMSMEWDDNLGNMERGVTGLKQYEQKVLDMLNEVGIAQFMTQMKKDVNYEPQLVIELFATQYQSYKEYADCLHFIINFLTYSLNDQLQQYNDSSISHSATQRLVVNFRQKLPSFFNCSKVTLWIKEPNDNILWSIFSHKPVKRSATQELVGQVLLKGTPITIFNHEDIKTHPAYDQTLNEQLYNDEIRKSCAIYPIFSSTNGTIIGVLELLNFKELEGRISISRDQQYFFMLLAKFAGIVIQKDLSEARSRKEFLLREKVNKYGMQILKSRTLQELTAMVEIAIQEIFNVTQVRLVIRQKDGKQVACIGDESVYEDSGIGISGQLIERGGSQICLVLNSYDDCRFSQKIDLQISTSMFCVPLVSQDAVIGLLEFENKQVKVQSSFTDSPMIRKQQTLKQKVNEVQVTDETLQNQLKHFSEFIVSTIELNKLNDL